MLASPVAGSFAERAGLRGQELVLQAGFEGEPLEAVQSFEDLRWRLDARRHCAALMCVCR